MSQRRALALALAVIVLWGGSARARAQEIADTWALDASQTPAHAEDTFGLRARNEAVAGEHGWIRADGQGGFVRGDGVPMRFWCATTYVQSRHGIPALQAHVRALAVRGVNMLRQHGRLNPPRPHLPIDSVDEREVEAIQRLVAYAKREGIYVTYSPYWANTARDAAGGWGLAGHAGGAPWGMLFFDEKLKAAYKAWLREAMLRPNPHDPERTPLARDPALAIFQIQNEDSLLFGTAQQIRGAKYAALDAKYHAWRQAKGLAAGPSLELRFGDLEHASESRRASMRFLAETMRAWNSEVERFLREELGYQGLINAGNWKTADNLRLLDLERWSYAANAVDAVNRYVQAGVHANPRDKRRAGYRIEAGDLVSDRPPLLDPGRLPFLVRQSAGRPFLISESGWVAPASFRAEGPLLVAAYSALHGIDGFYWFRLHHVAYDPGLEKWGTASPDVLGGWPAAALLFRRGDVKAAAPVVREARTQRSLFALAPPALPEAPGFDPNRDFVPARAQGRGRVDPLAYLVGPSIVSLDAAKDSLSVGELHPHVDRARKRVRSSTGEIELDWGRGVLSVDAPKAQGAAGFLASRSPLALAAVRIEAKSEYASLIVVSLDDRPLASSARLLLQTTTRARPTGWRTEPFERPAAEGVAPFSGERIVSVGAPPWRVWKSDLRVRIANAQLARACAVDPYLRVGAGVALARDEAGVELAIPGDAMYVLVEGAALPLEARRCSGAPGGERRARELSGEERQIP